MKRSSEQTYLVSRQALRVLARKPRTLRPRLFIFAITITAFSASLGLLLVPPTIFAQVTTDDFLFIHHSIGQHWLFKNGNQFMNALYAKNYIDDRNNTYYEVDIPNDAGRPDSLTGRTEVSCNHIDGPVPGSYTDQNHWVYWFNDYLNSIKHYDSAQSSADPFGGLLDTDTVNNKIIMFKSGFGTNKIVADAPSGRAPSPFVAGWHNTLSDCTDPRNVSVFTTTLADYQAVYTRDPAASYTENGYVYQPLNEVFAQNPYNLFIIITAPPWKIDNGTTNAEAHRARIFNTWLANDWINSYNAANPTLHNVAVFFQLFAVRDPKPIFPYHRYRYRLGSYPAVRPRLFCIFPAVRIG